MNKFFRHIFIIFLFINFVQADTLHFTQKEQKYIKNNKITVGLLHDFYPFTMYKNYKHEGITIDILKLISKKVTYK